MASTSAAPNSNDILSSAQFSSSARSSSSSPFVDAPTASSILSAQIDPAALHPLAGLVDNKDLDYLLLEDDKISGVEGGKSVLPSRGWGDELCYGTGSTYLAGLAAGGLWGFRDGLRQPIIPRGPTASSSLTPVGAAATGAAPTATAPLSASSTIGSQAKAFAESATASASAAAGGANPTAGATGETARQAAGRISARLRWNNILNQVTRRGSFTGNSAGVLALIYNGFNSTLDAYRGGKHDIYGSMAAGAATGALWKCTAGVQPMIIASGIMTVGAASWTVLKRQFL